MKKIIFLILISFFMTSCKIIGEENNKTIRIEKNDNLGIENLEDLINNKELDKVLILLEKKYISNSNDINNVLLYSNILALKGSLSYQEDKYADKAIKILNKLLLKGLLITNEQKSEIYRFLGYSYEIKEKYEESIKNYELSISFNINNYETYNNLGHAYKLLGENKKAKVLFEKSLSINPNFDHALLNMGNIYIGDGFIDKAQKNYEKVLEISTNKHFLSESSYTLGNIYLGNGNILESRNMFEKSNKFDPNFDLPYIGLAKVDFLDFIKELGSGKENINIKSFNSSLDNFNKAIDINPNKTLIYYQLGKHYKILGENKISNDLFKKALDVIDNDITLSKTEKEQFRKEIEDSIELESLLEIKK